MTSSDSPGHGAAPRRRFLWGVLIAIVALAAGLLLPWAWHAIVPSEEERQTQERGYWVDPSVDLMWVATDNGFDLTADQAAGYCDRLRLGGFENWRIPNFDELDGIYDRNNKYHLLGGLRLTGRNLVWQKSPFDGQETINTDWFVEPHGAPGVTWARALCVRNNAVQQASAPPKQLDQVPCHEEPIESVDSAAGTVSVGGETFKVQPSDVATIANWSAGDSASLCLNGQLVTMSVRGDQITTILVLDEDQAN